MSDWLQLEVEIGVISLWQMMLFFENYIRELKVLCLHLFIYLYYFYLSNLKKNMIIKWKIENIKNHFIFYDDHCYY